MWVQKRFRALYYVYYYSIYIIILYILLYYMKIKEKMGNEQDVMMNTAIKTLPP